MFNTGIYEIRNLQTNRRYIGSTNNFDERKKQHFKDLAAKKHVNRKLQTDFNMFGASAFRFSILEYTLESQRYNREQFWIDYYKDNSYNIATAQRNKKTTKNEIKKLLRSLWRWINQWIF